jgi:hypothetical protein
MTKARIGGEGRSLVEDRFAHGGAHRLTYLSIAELEILADLGVRNILEAGGAKSGMREQRRKFEKREAVCRENVERIAQQFVRPRAEVVQSPTLFQNLRKFCDPDEIRFRIFERVEAHRHFPVGGRDDNEPVAQMRLLLPLAGGDCAQEKRRRIAVQVKVYEPASCLDVLQTEILKERTLTSPRLSEERDVHGAAGWAQPHSPPRGLFIRNLKPESDIAAGFHPYLSPPLQAVPNRTHELFEVANHVGEYWGQGVENGNNLLRS